MSEYQYCLYISRQELNDDPPRAPISIADLEPHIDADKDFAWVSKDNPGARSVPGACGFVIAYKGDPCIEGDGLTFGVAEAGEALTIKLIRIAQALDANVFDSYERLDVTSKKGFFGSKDVIVKTWASRRSRDEVARAQQEILRNAGRR